MPLLNEVHMLKGLKFHYKLFISFSIFVFIILTVSGTLFYLYTVSIIEKNIEDNQKQTTQKLQEQLDAMLAEMDSISLAVNSSEYIMEVLRNIPQDPENNYFDKNPRINSAVKSALFSYMALKPIKGRITLLSREYDYIDLSNKFNNYIATKESMKDIPRISQSMASDKYKIFSAPHRDDWSVDRDTVFSVLRPIRDNYSTLGLVEISRNIQDINDICVSKDSSKKSYVAIYDENQKLIYHNFDEKFTVAGRLIYNDKMASSTFGSYAINDDLGKTTAIASFSRLSNANWTLVQLEDMEAYRKPVSLLRNVIVLTYILVFAVLLLVLYVFTGSLTRPVRKLKESLAAVDMENLKLALNHNSTNNEITLLGEAFQDLLSEVRESTRKMLQSRSREMKAHMLALQAQLNPHFLYNTLSVIGAFGQKKGNTEVARMCADLSRMLRYTVELKENNTRLESEIAHATSYLKLMSMRFEGVLEYSLEVDEAILAIGVPKLVLEPIIENIFKHGFVDVNPPWRVRIEGFTDGGRWYVRVRDNGRGFTAEAMEKLVQMLEEAKRGPSAETYSNDVEKGGLGLLNTFMRLNIHFNGSEHIEFHNAPEGGAAIVIGGPVQPGIGEKNV